MREASPLRVPPHFKCVPGGRLKCRSSGGWGRIELPTFLVALRCRSDGKCCESGSKSPGAGLFRAKQSGEIAARRRKAGCCLKGLTRFCTT